MEYKGVGHFSLCVCVCFFLHSIFPFARPRDLLHRCQTLARNSVGSPAQLARPAEGGEPERFQHPHWADGRSSSSHHGNQREILWERMIKRQTVSRKVRFIVYGATFLWREPESLPQCVCKFENLQQGFLNLVSARFRVWKRPPWCWWGDGSNTDRCVQTQLVWFTAERTLRRVANPLLPFCFAQVLLDLNVL